MQPDRLNNCIICGRLFVKEQIEYCLDCYQKMEQDFKRVDEFLQNEQNRLATLEMISTLTNVSKKRIVDFIRNGRIFAEDFPNLGYPCAHCGKLIKRQELCSDCAEKLISDIKKTLKKEKDEV